MKYKYQFYDEDEGWLTVDEYEFDTPEQAKQAGIDARFENVRVVIS